MALGGINSTSPGAAREHAPAFLPHPRRDFIVYIATNMLLNPFALSQLSAEFGDCDGTVAS